MVPNLRACIANIVAGLSNQSANSAVYDHTQGKHIHISGQISASSVNVYDHDRGSHISLTLNHSQFSGYDFGSGYHYSGSINGNAVVIYDHESGAHHHFNV